MLLHEQRFRYVRHENHFWRGSGSLFFQSSIVAVFFNQLFLHDLKVSTSPFSFCLLNFCFSFLRSHLYLRLGNATNKSLAQYTTEFTVTSKKFLDLFSTNKMMTAAVFFSILLPWRSKLILWRCAAHASCWRKEKCLQEFCACQSFLSYVQQTNENVFSETRRTHLHCSISPQKLNFCMEATKERVRYNMYLT